MDAVTQSKAKAAKGKTGGKNGQDARAAYYDRISKLDMAPLWVVLKDIIPEQPKTVCAPAIWRYKDVRPYVSEAGSIISAQEASRAALPPFLPPLPGLPFLPFTPACPPRSMTVSMPFEIRGWS